jgi:hypothetical protein
MTPQESAAKTAAALAPTHQCNEAERGECHDKQCPHFEPHAPMHQCEAAWHQCNKFPERTIVCCFPITPAARGGRLAAKNALSKAPTLSDGHDQATAKELLKRFNDAQTGMRRVVAFGLLAWEVKETKLKHGEFGAWLAAHCPKLCRPDSSTGKPKASDALNTYMGLTKGVLESVGFSVEKYLEHISNSRMPGICHGGKYLLLADKKLPESVRPLKDKICALVDGKTQRQLFLEFKQAEPDETGVIKPKHGRLKGQGGATKLQRDTAQQASENARLEALELRAVETSEWLLEVSDDKHLGLISELTRTRFCAALDTAAGYLRRLSKGSAI